MTDQPSSIEVTLATEATQEIVAAFEQLLPQLSSSDKALTLDALGGIIASPSNTLLLARDRTHGGKIVGTLTRVIFLIPTATRAWIEDVVADSSVRGRGIGEALTRRALQLATDRGARTIDLTSRRSRE